MNTTVIDKLGIPLTLTFGELEDIDFFQDTRDQLCVKIGKDRKLIWQGEHWAHTAKVDKDELVIPLKATITLERKAEK